MLAASNSDWPEASTKHASRSAKLAAGFSATLLFGAVAGFFSGRGLSNPRSSAEHFTQFAEVRSNNNFTVVHKERDLCSGPKDNCMGTKCCKISGWVCLQKNAVEAKCAASCPENGPCNIVSESIKFEVKDRKTMFCFSVYTRNTGSTKKSYEKELLAGQYEKKKSIFACEAFEVYSDVATTIAPGLDTIKVEDVDGDFHFEKRKLTGSWVNTGMFMQVWKAIGKTGTYLGQDWTIKVDPDCVFFPHKLIRRIHLLPVPPSGAFLNNCETVDFGFFGSLEVFDKAAFNTLVTNLDTCKLNTVAFWKVGIDGGKHGAMGEDLFAQICMEKNGVVKLDTFDINKDGACMAKRPRDQKWDKKWTADCSQTNTPAMHPFKKPAEHFKCMSEAEGLV